MGTVLKRIFVDAVSTNSSRFPVFNVCPACLDSSFCLVANIIQLVDFGVRAAANGRDLAGKGQTADQSYLHALTSEIQSICTVLDDGKLDMEDLFQKRGTDVDKTPAMTRRDRSNAHTQLDVKRLAGQTKDVASELGLMLNGLKVSNDPLSGTTATNGGRKRKRDVGKSLIKAIWQDSDMQDLRRKLVELQQQMILHLSVMQNQASGEILQALGSLSRKMEMERAQVLLRLESQQSSILEKAKNLVGSIDQSGAFQTLSLGLRSMTDQARKVNDCIHILDTLRFDEICMREEGIAEAHGKTFEWLFTKPELGFISWLTSKDGETYDRLINFNTNRDIRTVLDNWQAWIW
nr:hypothetical protein B0A51_02991 [Rachicladosporium sp. CCFEE 5018]